MTSTTSPRPYIGVSGLTLASQTRAALAVMPTHSSHLLMVGALATHETLVGDHRGLRKPGRYPLVEDIADVFVDDPRTLNLVHYATKNAEALPRELARLRGRYAGTLCHGVQLNLCWPDPASFREETVGWRVVLQVGPQALAAVDNDPEALATRLEGYAHHITDVLVDPSAGKGLCFDPKRATALLAAVRARHPTLGLGVAGGLCAATMASAATVAANISPLSLDAESGLRNERDWLSLPALHSYLTTAQEAVAVRGERESS